MAAKLDMLQIIHMFEGVEPLKTSVAWLIIYVFLVLFFFHLKSVKKIKKKLWFVLIFVVVVAEFCTNSTF